LPKTTRGFSQEVVVALATKTMDKVAEEVEAVVLLS
jgi:hypothetical protein